MHGKNPWSLAILLVALSACSSPNADSHEESEPTPAHEDPGPPGGGGTSGTPAVDAGTSHPDDTGSGATTPTEPSADPYPSGPYGFAEGAVMGNFAFMGYRDGAGAWTTIKMSEFYDPDGKKGVRALYLTLGEVGCGACVQEAPKINEWKAKYAPHGAAFLSALWRGLVRLPDGTFSPIQSTADAWIAKFAIKYNMVIDPKIQLAGGVEPTQNPTGWLVDTRTMKVAKYYGGAPGFLMGMDALLKKNGATGL